MKIKYLGGRPSVSTVLSGRVSYYFGEENSFIVDVKDANHVSQLLRSTQHRFVVATEEMIKAAEVAETAKRTAEKEAAAKKEKPKKEEKPKVETKKKEVKKKEKPKKKGKGKGKK